MVFTVTLSAASEQTVTVDYLTSNGSAVTPNDYQTVSGTLTFLPGQTTSPPFPGTPFRRYSQCLPDYLTHLGRNAIELRDREIAGLTTVEAIHLR